MTLIIEVFLCTVKANTVVCRTKNLISLSQITILCSERRGDTCRYKREKNMFKLVLTNYLHMQVVCHISYRDLFDIVEVSNWSYILIYWGVLVNSKRVHKIPWYFNWTLIQHAQAWSKCEAITVVKKPCKKISLLIWALWLFKEIYFWTDTIRSKTLLRLYTWHTIIHAVQDMHSVCANLAVIINKDKCSYQ